MLFYAIGMTIYNYNADLILERIVPKFILSLLISSITFCFIMFNIYLMD